MTGAVRCLITVPRYMESMLEAIFAKADGKRKPVLLVVDDLEQVLEDPSPQQRLPGVRAHAQASLRAVLGAFANAGTDSRLLLTSRYDFTAPDAKGRDLAAGLYRINLPEMNERERVKQWLLGPGRSVETGDIDYKLLGRALGAAGGNPGLQEKLTRPLASDKAAAERAIEAVEAYKKSGKEPVGDIGQFFVELTLAVYRDALTANETLAMRALCLFAIPVPREAAEAAMAAAGVAQPAQALDRLLALGHADIAERDDAVAADDRGMLANRLARPLFESLAEAASRKAARAAVDALDMPWRDRHGVAPWDARAYELLRLAELAQDRPLAVARAATSLAWMLRAENLDAARALAVQAIELLRANGRQPDWNLLRLGVELAESLGDGGQLQARLFGYREDLEDDDSGGHPKLSVAFASGLVQRGDTGQAMDLLTAAARDFDKLGDVRSRAVTLGKIADILSARGDLDEALRILNEELLPAFDKLGDVRSRAVALGKIADILARKGDLDGAMAMHRERLPVAEKLGDLESEAHVRFNLAQLRLAKGVESEEGAREAVENLGRAWAISLHLGRADFVLGIGMLWGSILLNFGEDGRSEAIAVLGEARDAAHKLGRDEEIARIEAMLAELGPA